MLLYYNMLCCVCSRKSLDYDTQLSRKPLTTQQMRQSWHETNPGVTTSRQKSLAARGSVTMTVGSVTMTLGSVTMTLESVTMTLESVSMTLEG